MLTNESMNQYYPVDKNEGMRKPGRFRCQDPVALPIDSAFVFRHLLLEIINDLIYELVRLLSMVLKSFPSSGAGGVGGAWLG